MALILGTHNLLTWIEERGPRWAVRGTIRSGEHAGLYVTSGERAEEIYQRFVADGYRQVRVIPPDGSVDLAALRTERERVQRSLTDVMQRLEAAALGALAAGRAEAEVAREAGVDRMTVRKWAGKR